MRVDELDYDLPAELIAQAPANDRAGSRLLHYHRSERSIVHRRFAELPLLLQAGDLLVMNDARVTPARFTLVKATGGRVDGLFVEQREPQRAVVMLKNLGPQRPDAWLTFERSPTTRLRVLEKHEGGLFTIQIDGERSLVTLLDEIGRMPLPPYIRRERGEDERDPGDRERYQTTYAATPGSIAAPTAGLHFTPEVLAALATRGIDRAFVTLHVGLGTFKPVEADDLASHVMHVERYELSPASCAIINRAKREGRRIVAVGTTTTRVLESQPAGELRPHAGQTQLLIAPPCAFKHVGALVTNFHQPRSTLIALVAAFMSLDEQRRAYCAAIDQRYRFFSYGDAMLIE